MATCGTAADKDESEGLIVDRVVGVCLKEDGLAAAALGAHGCLCPRQRWVHYNVMERLLLLTKYEHHTQRESDGMGEP